MSEVSEEEIAEEDLELLRDALNWWSNRIRRKYPTVKGAKIRRTAEENVPISV